MITHRRLTLGLLVAGTVALTGCAVTAVPGRSLDLPAQTPFAVLPFSNATDVPQVERRAEAITVSLLQQKGLQAVTAYPQPSTDNPLETTPQPSPAQELAWARKLGARYALSGTVTEWRYKTGVDAEPAVGITLQVTNVDDGRVVWSASGGRSGWGYQALSAVGQAQIDSLLGGLRVQLAPAAKPKP